MKDFDISFVLCILIILVLFVVAIISPSKDRYLNKYLEGYSDGYQDRINYEFNENEKIMMEHRIRFYNLINNL